MPSSQSSGDKEASSQVSNLPEDTAQHPVNRSEFQYNASLDGVKRGLGRQHIQMIALAGVIGTGLFLGLGEILALCGPLGALIVYAHVSSVVYATLTSVGELCAFAPISGTLIHYAARWVDPALGFAMGWVNAAFLNYYYFTSTAIATEVTAFSVFVSFWDANPDHTGIYVAVMIVLLIFINLFGLKIFGHSEIFFAFLKIFLIVGLIIAGLVVTCGGGPDHETIGFRYWRDPGPFVSFLEPGGRGRWVGMLVAIVPAAFSLSGAELIAITIAEAKNPRKNIVLSMRTVLFRLIFFYLFAVLIVGMLVPSNDPRLFQRTGTAGISPFVLAFNRAGIKVLPSIINAILLTCVFSAGNTFLYAASRILYGLSLQGQSPRIFSTCTKGGTPWVAVLTTGLFSLLAFLNVKNNSGVVFTWFISLATMGGLFGWLSINITYIRYHFGLKKQGIKPEGIYRSWMQPYSAIWAIFWIIFYILVSGVSTFWQFQASSFVAAYINIPIFLCLYTGYKIIFRTKIQPLADLDFVSNIPTLEETEDDPYPTKKTLAENIKEMI
ncbi:general amino acid permease 1 [Coniophora puteana RWD-64-598 SS2]|uniref:General amino acid permease 1 n=1 Tax=Coniophora puteana (strain RWD-64-598) TaxID=741705 RepID=A0A5M3MKC6_CONPW|nr:general amino acid permease 1 [Coniophora puteana RWD-64-598 SS2]EIW79688.1 general amino acid permease 1 [Coniophora puteana RWD-64-598 SS2]